MLQTEVWERHMTWTMNWINPKILDLWMAVQNTVGNLSFSDVEVKVEHWVYSDRAKNLSNIVLAVKWQSVRIFFQRQIEQGLYVDIWGLKWSDSLISVTLFNVFILLFSFKWDAKLQVTILQIVEQELI